MHTQICTHSHIRMVSLLPLTPKACRMCTPFPPPSPTLCAQEKLRDALTQGSHWLAENPLNSSKTRPGSTFCSSAWGPVSCRDVEGTLPSVPRLSHRQLSSSSRPTCTHSCGAVSLLNKSLSPVGSLEPGQSSPYPERASICRGLWRTVSLP